MSHFCVIGVREGDEVSVHYDPMIAKLVVWSSDRHSALRKLRSCLSEYNIIGLNTNVDFLMQLSSHGKFVEGDVHTSFIDQHYDELFPQKVIGNHLITQAAIASLLNEITLANSSQRLTLDPYNPFMAYPASRLNLNHQRQIKLSCQGAKFNVLITFLADGKYKLKIENNPELEIQASLQTRDSVGIIELNMDGELFKSRVVFRDENIHLFTQVC